MPEILEKKFGFLHNEPYNKDIYNHIQCSTALLWPMVHSRELKLLTDVTASWKQRRWRGTSSASTVKKVILKDKTIAKCLVVSSHVLTLKHEAEQQLLTPKQLFQLRQETNKQFIMNGLLDSYPP